MKKRTPVSSIMTKNMVTLNTTDTLEIAETLFKENNIRHIPVVSGSHCVGMLSYTDLLRVSYVDAAYEDEQEIDTTVYNMFSIAQVMAKNVVHVSSDTTIKEVATLISKKEFHALPVVDDGDLVGIVTTTDLINYLLEQY